MFSLYNKKKMLKYHVVSTGHVIPVKCQVLLSVKNTNKFQKVIHVCGSCDCLQIYFFVAFMICKNLKINLARDSLTSNRLSFALL